MLAFNKNLFFCINIIGLLIFSSFFLIVYNAQAVGWKLEVGLPGFPAETEVSNPGQYFRMLYLAGLGIAGILSVGVIVYAGFLWMTSPAVGTVENAKKMIWGAISGLILLMGSYLILYIINPALVSLTPPELQSTNIGTGGGGGSGDDGGGGSGDGNPLNQLFEPIDPTTYGFTFKNARTGNCESTQVDKGFEPALTGGLQNCKNLLKISCATSPCDGHSFGSCHYAGLAIDIMPNDEWGETEWPLLRNCLNTNNVGYFEEDPGSNNWHFHIGNDSISGQSCSGQETCSY